MFELLVNWLINNPTQAVVVYGAVTTVLVGLFKLLGRVIPALGEWLACDNNLAKFQKTLAAVLAAFVVSVAGTLATGWTGIGPFLLAWLSAFGLSQGIYLPLSRVVQVASSPEEPC